MHALVGLIIPTVLFVVAVFGEVYAERILDAILRELDPVNGQRRAERSSFNDHRTAIAGPQI